MKGSGREISTQEKTVTVRYSKRCIGSCGSLIGSSQPHNTHNTLTHDPLQTSYTHINCNTHSYTHFTTHKLHTLHYTQATHKLHTLHYIQATHTSLHTSHVHTHHYTQATHMHFTTLKLHTLHNTQATYTPLHSNCTQFTIHKLHTLHYTQAAHTSLHTSYTHSTIHIHTNLFL